MRGTRGHLCVSSFLDLPCGMRCAQDGACPFGEKCKFKHDPAAVERVKAAAASAAASTSTSASAAAGSAGTAAAQEDRTITGAPAAISRKQEKRIRKQALKQQNKRLKTEGGAAPAAAPTAVVAPTTAPVKTSNVSFAASSSLSAPAKMET
jgi:hypothetical protein